MLNENEPMSKLKIFDGALKSIGIFIGTYGLAVFLVVYYAIKLYPELREERGEWIKQITVIRQIVDPETRPLTRAQADAIMDITINVYLNQLKNSEQLISQGTDRGYSSSSSIDGSVSIEFWGEEYKIETGSNEEHLKKLLNQFFSEFYTRNNEYNKFLVTVFDSSKEKVDSSLYPLSRLKYGAHTLEDIWKQATLETRNIWLTSLSGISTSEMNSYIILEFIKFVKKHPAMSSDNKDVKALLVKLYKFSDSSSRNTYSVLRKELESKVNVLMEKVNSETKWLQEPNKEFKLDS